MQRRQKTEDTAVSLRVARKLRDRIIISPTIHFSNKLLTTTMDKRPPPAGFHSYNAAASAQPPNPNVYRHTQGPPVPTAYAASPMTFGYNYNYNQSSTSASPWSSAQSTAVPGYVYPNTATPNAPGLDNTGSTQQQQPKTWTCDACDVTVESERALKAHRKSHVKCTECSFEGVPKVVKGHYMANHGKFSGAGFKTVTVSIPGCRVQRFRVCVGNRPEDIKKWIADRKKRFPRRAKAEPNKDSVVSPKDTTTEAPKTSGLSSLLGGYGSSSDSEDETPNKKEEEKKDNIQKEPIQATSAHLTETSSTTGKHGASPNAKIPSSTGSRPCRFFMRNGKCLNGDACRFSHDLSNQPRRKPESKKRKRGKSSSNDTLLRKLLSNDMDREETLALQLLEHIFDAKFFDGEHGRKKQAER
mmetsp:Transcript_41572/g.100116  ORF Transcript_41572/g.100116 Transcript_41572/m.100116 type:complete len:414 (-) Transcript_41572:882-2123(-)